MLKPQCPLYHLEKCIHLCKKIFSVYVMGCGVEQLVQQCKSTLLFEDPLIREQIILLQHLTHCWITKTQGWRSLRILCFSPESHVEDTLRRDERTDSGVLHNLHHLLNRFAVCCGASAARGFDGVVERVLTDALVEKAGSKPPL